VRIRRSTGEISREQFIGTAKTEQGHGSVAAKPGGILKAAK